jgi:hypothetical protein
MGQFYDDKEGHRQSIVHASTADVTKHTSKYAEAATRALAPRASRTLTEKVLRPFSRRSEVADIEAAVRVSKGVSEIQDNVMHIQTAFARGTNEVERLQNENEQLRLDRKKLERLSVQIDRQNAADEFTFATLLEVDRLKAETKRLEAMEAAVAAAARLGLDVAYITDQRSLGQEAKSIAVLEVERHKADKLRDVVEANARVIDQKLTSEHERVRKEKKVREEKLTPLGASAEELSERAQRIVDEALSGIVMPDSADRYLHATAGAKYYAELIAGTSDLAARRLVFDATLRALKMDAAGTRRATRDLALSDLQTYHEKKAEYEQITQAGAIGDLVEQIAGGHTNVADPIR